MILEKYVYKSHLGGIYFLDDYDSSYEEQCETCGDGDYCIGYFETKEKLKKWMKKEGYAEEYIDETIEEVLND
ncbi:hypothetical protein [Streptococcus parauberis]|uniref:hypothetical protein n=1 Tax=Streptococcus parauberis TaxID=1348 RepID=UPI000789BA5D|nr:hypothetical protein [Streptococcus parauberis]KYP17727.1 hypothetical protein TN39_01938 [Streptococcus parauberis]KYP18618.1 hypothetical protein AKL14_00904 [Streptococcus parauberis]KYP20021.1 hypothetical protein AKL13_00821 [Streptococcus parauberis]KYP27352.1 hypothetical protein TM50_00658 [Streptococcus parauberis]KYP27618.1 hypothetical protein TP84_00487 [Streptococcus parauberis]